MQDYDLSVGEKFAAAQRIISALYPSLTSFYLMCNLREVNDDITLRLNTKFGLNASLEYNASFINSLTSQTLSILVSIELFRLVLHHPTTRLLYPTDICYKASNIICTDDSTIMTLPIDRTVKAKFPVFDDIKKLDAELDPKVDFYLEHIFNILYKNMPKQEEQEPNNTPGPNSGGSGGSSASDGSSPNDSEGETGQESEDLQEKERKAINKHFNSNNMKKATEGWGENDMLDTKIRNQVQREMQNVTSWGRMPGQMKDRIKKYNELIYDPRAIFTNFTRSVFSTVETFTRMKPPRRLGQRYIGIIPGKRHEQRAKVLIAFDSSGSMSDDDLAKGLGFMESCLRHAEIYYCWWDCICTEFTKIRSPKPEYDLSGRGGTNPQCVIDKLDDEKIKFDGLVLFTDCYFSWDRPDVRQDICIVQTDKSGTPPAWVDWTFKLKDLARCC